MKVTVKNEFAETVGPSDIEYRQLKPKTTG